MHLANGGKDHVNSIKQNLKVTILKNCLKSKVFELKDWKDCQIMRLSRTAFPGCPEEPSEVRLWVVFHQHHLPACCLPSLTLGQLGWEMGFST